MLRPSLKTSGFLALLFFTAVAFTRDGSNFVRATYFGIQDGAVPQNPREWRGGRY